MKFTILSYLLFISLLFVPSFEENTTFDDFFNFPNQDINISDAFVYFFDINKNYYWQD